MNNQAAQTMPECTCPDNGGCTNPCDRKAFQAVPLSEELLIEAAILSGNTPQERRLQKVMTQAAAALSQTAELPEPEVHDAAGFRRAYTADQMHQYARDYAAALSQTAGVVDGGPGDCGDMARAWLAVTETLNEVFPQWTESEKVGRECACDAIRFLADRSRLAAAPAASGGEDDRSGWCRSDGCVHKKFGEPTWKEGDNPFQSSPHPDALPDGTLSKSTAKRVDALAASGGEPARTLPIDIRGQWYEVPIPVHVHVVNLREKLNSPATFFTDDTALADWLDSLHATNDDGAATDEKWKPAQRAAAFLRGELTAPNPPTSASVSERARALLADEYERNGHLERAAIVRGQALHPDSLDAIHLRALEQALTQQRGECPRTWPCAKHPRAEIKTDGFPIEPLKVFDLGPWTWTETGHQFTGIDLDGAAFSAYRDYFNGTTTPQPSADAVGEVIGSMLNFADVADKCELTEGNAQVAIRVWASQLESLLSGGSHA